MTYQIKFIIPFFQEINTYQVDSAKAKLQGIHMSVTFEMIRLIIWQVLCSAELQGFHMSMTLSNCMLKVSNWLSWRWMCMVCTVGWFRERLSCSIGARDPVLHVCPSSWFPNSLRFNTDPHGFEKSEQALTSLGVVKEFPQRV